MKNSRNVLGRRIDLHFDGRDPASEGIFMALFAFCFLVLFSSLAIICGVGDVTSI